MATVDVAALQARRAQMDAEIQRHREAIAALEAKRDELDIGMRVIAEYAVQTPESVSIEAEEAQTTTDIPAAPIKAPRRGSAPREPKPDSVPAMPEMIREALLKAHQRGKLGLKPIEITDYIQEHYWAGCPPEAVSPIAWRMWNRGELVKNESHYSLHTGERTMAVVTGLVDNVMSATRRPSE